MDRIALFYGLGSVAAAAAGQIFMRLSQTVDARAVAGIKVSWPLVIGLAWHGFAAVLWLAVLGRMPLSRAYPLTASTQVVVPVVAWLILGERIGWQTGLSAGLAAAAVAVLSYGR